MLRVLAPLWLASLGGAAHAAPVAAIGGSALDAEAQRAVRGTSVTVRLDFVDAAARRAWLGRTGHRMRCASPASAWVDTTLDGLQALGFAVHATCSDVTAGAARFHADASNVGGQRGPSVGDRTCDAGLVHTGANGNTPPVAVPAALAGQLRGAAEQIDPKFDAYDDSTVAGCGFALTLDDARTALARCAGDDVNASLACLDGSGEAAWVTEGGNAPHVWFWCALLGDDAAHLEAWNTRSGGAVVPDADLQRWVEHMATHRLDERDLATVGQLLGHPVPDSAAGRLALVLEGHSLLLAVGSGPGG